ncbi:MAG: deoxyguanosinetriphosphate triphosphohydrolase [Planctomycetes bacterium]|nr:deoxyguanosinetriphosphate triphosphohydrolase [Planctomycetota bacterium]
MIRASMQERFSFLDRRAKQLHEEAHLIPAALHSGHSAGRAKPEPEDELRTAYERDRDRIIHCTAFRRLMHKTQVFVSSDGDHHRTRMSHSLEVAQVARSIASALRLNESFCEALALAHDIGHPPFGHRGEWALDALMRDHGGFRHNAQVLRVVDLLERRSPDYAGLNLTRELRESLLKHEKAEDWPAEFGARPRSPYLEAQVVDLADSTAYNVHDVEDGLRAGMFDESALETEVELWKRARASVEQRHPGFLASTNDVNLRVKRITTELLKALIEDLVRASAARLAERPAGSPAEARAMQGYAIGHGDVLEPMVAQLHAFLYRHFYRHPTLRELERRAASVLSELFESVRARPAELPPWYRGWVDRVGLERAVCDYIAGMTDRFAEREHARLREST